MTGREVDVVVVGAGGTGSATAWQLAAEGREVLLIEARSATCAPGAPRTDAAVFRVADGELADNHLALRALPLWRELERETAAAVLTLTGEVAHGSTTDLDLLSWTADAVGKPGRWLPPAEAVERWPGIRYGERIFLHPLAGRIDTELAVVALRRAAVRKGAVIRYGEPATGIDVRGTELVEVRTTEGSYRARRVVVAAGARSVKLLGGLVPLPPLRVTWEQSARFESVRAELDWPVFFHYLDRTELAAGGYPSGVRGVAVPGTGVEAGFFAPGVDEADSLAVSRRLRALRRYAHEWLPGADPDAVSPTECRYTVASDCLLDRAGPVVVGTGFSGPGFKFLPVVGRALAELTTTGDPRPTGRFALPPAP